MGVRGGYVSKHTRVVLWMALLKRFWTLPAEDGEHPYSILFLDIVSLLHHYFQVSKFSMPSWFRHEAKVTQNPLSLPFLQHKESIQLDLADSAPSTSVSQRGPHVGIFMSDRREKNLYISPQKYILTDLQCFLAVERPVINDQITPTYSNNVWFGSGSLSWFDMTLSLYEMKMVLSAFGSFSKAVGAAKLESRH